MSLGIQPEYFLDKMSQSELHFIVEGLEELDVEDWERTRTVCFYIVMSDRINTRSVKSPQDLFPLPWDKKKIKKTMSKEDMRKLTEQINSMQHGQ